MTKLYVAFGSNLSKKQMRFRCPTARPLGKFMLTQARLVFRGVADLEYDETAMVPCGLWAINEADEASLDGYEGIEAGIYFKTTQKMTYCGRERKALVYLMNSNAIFPPSQAYADKIRRGYRDFGLDETYLDEAIRRSFDKNPDEYTLERRERQRATREHAKLVELPP